MNQPRLQGTLWLLLMFRGQYRAQGLAKAGQALGAVAQSAIG